MEQHFIKSVYSAVLGLIGSFASITSVSEVLTVLGAAVSICSGCLASYHLMLGIRIRKRDIKERENDGS
jgi:hydrogenase-4 membrane subunit HyfE